VAVLVQNVRERKALVAHNIYRGPMAGASFFLCLRVVASVVHIKAIGAWFWTGTGFRNLAGDWYWVWEKPFKLNRKSRFKGVPRYIATDQAALGR